MKITVFGAGGKVGRLVVTEALARDHSVVAFVHHDTNFTKNPKLEVIQGDVREQEKVALAIKDTDAVISSLGSWGTPSKDILTTAMLSLTEVMKSSKVSRIVSLTGSDARSAFDVPTMLNSVSRPLFNLIAGKVLYDGEQHIRLLQQSELNWTVVRSPVMNERGKPDDYRLVEKRPYPWQSINRHAVAKSMVDLAESNDYIGTSPFIVRS